MTAHVLQDVLQMFIKPPLWNHKETKTFLPHAALLICMTKARWGSEGKQALRRKPTFYEGTHEAAYIFFGNNQGRLHALWPHTLAKM
jgi:hypothetical protein